MFHKTFFFLTRSRALLFALNKSSSIRSLSKSSSLYNQVNSPSDEDEKFEYKMPDKSNLDLHEGRDDKYKYLFEEDEEVKSDQLSHSNDRKGDEQSFRSDDQQAKRNNQSFGSNDREEECDHHHSEKVDEVLESYFVAHQSSVQVSNPPEMIEKISSQINSHFNDNKENHDDDETTYELTPTSNSTPTTIYNQYAPVDFDPNSKVFERDYIETIRPELQPTFRLATYANHMDIIRQLIKLNVRLYKIEKNRDLTQFLIRLDFDRDVIPYLNFLIRCGFRREDLGEFLTENFGILRENIVNLEKRIKYYKKMHFTDEEILYMMIRFPGIINYPIEYVDARLGFYQRYLRIKPFQVRRMLVNFCRILKIAQYRTNMEKTKFILVEQCGFSIDQMKQILIECPKILLKNEFETTTTFEYIFENITNDYELIVKFPRVLNIRRKILEERDLYLKKLGRAQYNPTKPLYVPLSAFEILEDEEFVAKYCRTSLKEV